MIKYLLFFFIFIQISAFAFEISGKSVVVKSDDSKVVTKAAEDLVYYLGTITSGSVRVLDKVPADAKSVIVLHEDARGLKEDGFRLRSEGNRLYITGQNERGLFYGVFYFLDRYLGVKFLAADYEYLPHFSRKDLGEISDVQEPAFWYREIFFHEGDDPVFSLKNLLNGRLGHRTLQDEAQENYTGGINTYSFTSSELLGDDFTCSGQYQYGNPRAQVKAAKALDAKLSQLDTDRECIVILEHEDRGSVCRESGKSASAAFLEYTSYLAKKLGKKYPYVCFYHQAYLWSREVPAHAKKLPSNLGVHFAPIEADFSKPLTEGENKKMWRQIKGWGKLTKSVIVWHYTVDFGGYLFPYPNTPALAQDIRNLRQLPYAKGLFLQGSYETIGGDLAPLRLWVFARLLWNPNQDVDKLISEFCRYYYGRGAESVVAYIKKRRALLNRSGDALRLKTPIDAAYLSDANLAELNAVLERGLRKVQKGTPFYEHYLALFPGIDYIRLIRGKPFRGRAHVKKRFLDYLAAHPDLTHIAEGVSSENMVKVLTLKHKKAAPPKVAAGLREGKEWFSYQEYQLELCCADIVEDHEASDGVSAVMPGSSQEWGFSLKIMNLPKGIWDLYADVKIKTDKKGIFDAVRWALRYGIEPGVAKGIKLTANFEKGYRSVKIGTIDTATDAPDFVWISPPGNSVVSKVYVDRIYFVKRR